MSASWLTDVFVSFFKKWFGNFSAQELKKYALLGCIFLCIIATYWTLRPLKDAIFGSVVGGGAYLAIAKIVSLAFLFPLIAIYGKLVHRFKRHHMFYVAGGCYICALVVWSIIFALPEIGLTNTITSPWRISGWLWYAFVESFGSIMIALFWAFTTDISDHKSAKYGFPLVALIGQVGGIFAPRYLTKLPLWLNTTNAPLIALLSVFIFTAIALVITFMRVIPPSAQEGFKPAHEQEVSAGFFDGLKLLVQNRYLLGIFAIIFFFEVIGTFLDFNFKTRVIELLSSDTARSAYLGDFASTINIVTFLCILFGINNISRWLGIRIALGVVIPVFIAGTVITLKFYNNIDNLFWLVVGVKAVWYALNSPTMKQLYIPTSQEAKYQSQAWIETFGSRGAKATSSGINALRGFLGAELYLSLLFYISFGLLATWVYIAFYLSKEHTKAINENRIVC